MSKVLFLCALVLIVGSGCATMLRQPCDPEEKTAKTLFSWEVGPKNENDKKEIEENGDVGKKDMSPAVIPLSPTSSGAELAVGSEKGKGAEKAVNGEDKSNGSSPQANAKAEEKDTIVTDRPDFTEASSTVGKGRIQLEAGYTYSRNRDAGIQNSHSYPEALLRVGMIAEWFEFRIGQNFSNTRTLGANGGVFSVNGGEDLYLGTKLGLTEQKKYLPEIALILQMTVPTGPKSLTAGKTLPGLNYLYSWEVNDFLSVGASSQGNATVDDNGHTYLELAQSVTVGYTLTEKLGAYTEWFAFFPTGATAPGTSAQHYVNGGFTYKITPLFQLDIRAGKGLSRNADDYFLGAGFAVKY